VVGSLGLDPPVFLDPFRGGRLFEREICDRIVINVTGGAVTSAAPYLAPTPPRTFLTRMLNNLQLSYWHRHLDRPGLLAARMLCVLNPGAADPIKMRGLFYDRLGEVASALADYEAYLRREPASPDTQKLRRRIGYLRSALREGG
jgi:regulator of sirC expression with transglutaminase-like and TPR domain